MKTMKKTIFWLSLMFVASASAALAQTVHLKDGTQVTGKILEKTSYYTTVEVNGRPVRYFSDQIESIEEEAAPSAAISTQIQLPEISPTKLNLINLFLEVNGTRESIRKRIEEVTASAPEAEKTRVKDLFNEEEIIAKLIPVYNRYYTEEEIRGLVDFYNSPVGKKTLEVTPALVRDVVKATFEYFQAKLKQ